MTKIDCEETEFFSAGLRCRATLFQPKDCPANTPVIIMAHGFAGQRHFVLPKYATRFAEQGFVVLTFDYRHFGDSEGQPRDLIHHRRQHVDWMAAIEFICDRRNLEPSRIGLWGSSFSGGHVVWAAARERNIGAISMQAPMLNIPKSLRMNMKFGAKAFALAITDYCRAAMGRQPLYIPVTCEPTQFGALNQPGCTEGFQSILPDDVAWHNRCTARSLLRSLTFIPSRHVRHVTCPALLAIADHDQVIRTRYIETMAAKFPKVEVVRYPVDHFEIFHGDCFEHLVRRQLTFFKSSLQPRPDQ